MHYVDRTIYFRFFFIACVKLQLNIFFNKPESESSRFSQPQRKLLLYELLSSVKADNWLSDWQKQKELNMLKEKKEQKCGFTVD